MNGKKAKMKSGKKKNGKLAAIIFFNIFLFSKYFFPRDFSVNSLRKTRKNQHIGLITVFQDFFFSYLIKFKVRRIIPLIVIGFFK